MKFFCLVFALRLQSETDVEQTSSAVYLLFHHRLMCFILALRCLQDLMDNLATPLIRWWRYLSVCTQTRSQCWGWTSDICSLPSLSLSLSLSPHRLSSPVTSYFPPSCSAEGDPTLSRSGFKTRPLSGFSQNLLLLLPSVPTVAWTPWTPPLLQLFSRCRRRKVNNN